MSLICISSKWWWIFQTTLVRGHYFESISCCCNLTFGWNSIELNPACLTESCLLKTYSALSIGILKPGQNQTPSHWGSWWLLTTGQAPGQESNMISARPPYFPQMQPNSTLVSWWLGHGWPWPGSAAWPCSGRISNAPPMFLCVYVRARISHR
jgi:hypothetical protein